MERLVFAMIYMAREMRAGSATLEMTAHQGTRFQVILGKTYEQGGELLVKLV
jgi:hypothetical protein